MIHHRSARQQPVLGAAAAVSAVDFKSNKHSKPTPAPAAAATTAAAPAAAAATTAARPGSGIRVKEIRFSSGDDIDFDKIERPVTCSHPIPRPRTHSAVLCCDVVLLCYGVAYRSAPVRPKYVWRRVAM